MQLNEKEVDFYSFCEKCIHKEREENMDPCWDCLTIGMRLGSHKPEYFDPREEVRFSKPVSSEKPKKKRRK